MPTQYAIVPVEGESVGGRQWGYHVVRNGETYLHVTAGAAGACWNVTTLDIDGDDEMEPALHVCDLDSFVNALLALLYSDIDREHCARWGEQRTADERPIEGTVVGDRQAHVYAGLTGLDPQPLRIPPGRPGDAEMEQEEPWPLWRRLLDRIRARRS